MSGRVPPSSRARGKLARRGDRSIDEKRAASLFTRFTGHDAECVAVYIDPLPKAVAVIGQLDGVLYTTIRDGAVEKYVHTFAQRSKPLLCVSPDGTRLFVVGGRYRFGSRGIVDK